MTKSKKCDTLVDFDEFASSDQIEIWDTADEGDESFWEEFFRLEELSQTVDELLSGAKVTLKSSVTKLNC